MLNSILDVNPASGSDASGLVLTLIIVGAAVGLLYGFVLRGIFRIGANQVGILAKKFGGKQMPQGQIVARNGEIGLQARTLMPGLYYRFPITWSWFKDNVIEIPEGKVGLVEALDGKSLPSGRKFGDQIDCSDYQDALAFLNSGGHKGPQIGILRQGKFRINTRLFVVTPVDSVKVLADQTGIVTANDGQPLPSKLIIAPEPTKPIGAYTDAQAFIDSNGYRGPQLPTLQPGEYNTNTKFFNVTIVPIAEVRPGFVGVIRSNVGEELEQSTVTQSVTNATPLSTMEEDIHAAESLLVTDKKTRGIWKDPLAPGKYNLNTVAYTKYDVPTSALVVSWSDIDSPNAPKMKTSSGSNDTDYKYPYLTSNTEEGYAFNRINVTTKDGFVLGIEVKMVIRIPPEEASFVIARFGTVLNLIQQIVHPLIDASFRNNAGEKEALAFIQSRTALQAEALEKAKEAFEKYHVEAQGLLISGIVPMDEKGEALLQTQTDKQLAQQQQTQYQEQTKAQDQRVALQERTARADMQAQVVQSSLNIDINRNNANAAIEQAKGLQQSTIIQAEGTKQSTILQAEGNKQSLALAGEGNASATEAVGKATAIAYQVQSAVIGADGVVRLGVMDRIRGVRPETLVPRVQVTTGNGDGGNGLVAGLLATVLADKTASNTMSAPPSDSKEDDEPATNAFVQPVVTAPTLTPVMSVPQATSSPSPTNIPMPPQTPAPSNKYDDAVKVYDPKTKYKRSEDP